MRKWRWEMEILAIVFECLWGVPCQMGTKLVQDGMSIPGNDQLKYKYNKICYDVPHLKCM